MVTVVIISLLVGAIITLLLIAGLVLLTRAEGITINGNQKYLIIVLGLAELVMLSHLLFVKPSFFDNGSEANIIALCAPTLHYDFFGFMYYFFTFAITFDRFLELRLNIKYHLYWNKERAKNTLISVCCIVNVSWVVSLCYHFVISTIHIFVEY